MPVFLTLILINFIGVVLISGNSNLNTDAEDTFVFICMDIGAVRSVDVTISLLSESPAYQSKTKMTLKSAKFLDTEVEVQNFHSMSLSYPNDCVQGSNDSYNAVTIISLIQIPEGYSAIVHFKSRDSTEIGESLSLLSMDQHGTEYYAVTYCEIYGECQLAVAAYTNNTEVTITLPSHNSNLKIVYNNQVFTPGKKIVKIMNRLDAVHLQCDCDLSGTRVESTKNVAVFSGSREAVVGVKGKKSFLIEQLPPVKAWKQEYAYVCSYCGRKGAFLRVIAAKVNTEIHISGYNSVVITSSGGWIHRRIENNNAVYIKANKPILVVAFVMNRFSGSEMYASSMHLVPAVESYTHSYNVLFPTFADKIEFTLIGPIRNGTFSIQPNATGTISTRYFSNTDLHSVSFASRNKDGKYKISYDYNFGMYALITTLGKTSHAFQPVSRIPPKQIPVPPEFDGDGIDSDNKNGVDNEDCSSEKDPRDRAKRDCKKYYSKDQDTKGYDFQIVFPSFDSEEKTLLIDIAGKDISYSYHGDCAHDVPKTSTASGNLNGINVASCFKINDTSYFQNKAIALTTTVEATVLVSVIGRSSRAAYIAFPTDVLGREYFTVTYCADGSHCGCVVSSPYNDTTITIKLSDNKGSVKVNWKNVVYEQNGVMVVTIQSYKDAFMFTSANDLTGTYIKADAPISVVCGGNTKSAMYIEQMSPIEKAGKQYSTTGDTVSYRVIATESNTIVKTTGTITNRKILRRAGDSEDFSYSEITSISSSRPVFVVGLYEKNNQGDMFNVIPDDEREHGYMCKVPDKTENKSLIIIGTARQNITLRTNDGIQNIETALNKRVEVYKLSQSSNLFHVEGDDIFAAYIAGESQMQAGMFIIPLGRKMKIKPKMCTPTPAIVGDKIDNDCDGLTDEEVCVKDIYRHDEDDYLTNNKYIADYDIDGMLDEDCFTEISVPSSTIESSSLETSTDFTSDSLFTTVYAELSSSIVSEAEITPYLTTTAEKTPPLTVATDFITTAPPIHTIMTTSASSPGNWYTISSTMNSVNPPVSAIKCKCPCNRVPNPQLQNITVQQLKAIMEETKKELTLNKTNLTFFKLKKNKCKGQSAFSSNFWCLGYYSYSSRYRNNCGSGHNVIYRIS